MKRIINGIEKAEYVLMVIGILVAVCLLFLQVVLRYVFSASLPWVEEAARYLFIYFTWIGTSIAATSGQHIRFEILFNKFPGSKKYLDLVSHVVCMAISLCMMIYGVKLVRTLMMNVAVSPTKKIPMWICYAIVPVAGLLMALKYIYLLADGISHFSHKEVSD